MSKYVDKKPSDTLYKAFLTLKTEEECRQKGIDYEVAKLSMRYSGRFVAENEGGDGIVKLIIDNQHNNLLGVHMIGSLTSISLIEIFRE